MPHDKLHRQTHDCDVCVIGGGMAGLCAAIASARNGARTLLVHDRPVLGGNASSEVRMWVCGAHGKFNKETGILEEIQLDNAALNPALSYSVWDSVLWAKAALQPGLTLLLNASVCDAAMHGDRIHAVRAWQLTSQTWHTVHARCFIDCSGDSILAALTPAEFRVGREARHEFDEDIQPALADDRTMGNSLLIQLRNTDEPQPFTPPRWAYRFESPDDLPHRIQGVRAHNFWWIELGGLHDTIRDAEAIRDDLLRAVYGVWDYIKNRAPERRQAANWAIEWIGSLPGKRENRRYLGDHTLTQHDVRSYTGWTDGPGRFDDIVAYGGWSMDDHHPAGLLYPGKPTIFHPAPSPYGIPYRCLYSRNIPNLLFAGRNISVTHAALSSTRVMATCAILGQAAGTAAALCVTHRCDPRSLSSGQRLRELQRTLMDDDCWLPGVARPMNPLTASASLSSEATGGDPANVQRLRDGIDRDRQNQPHAWEAPVGSAVTYQWHSPVRIGGLRLVFDSNLANDKRMPCSYPQRGDRSLVPTSLVRAFRVESLDDSGRWQTVHRTHENRHRLLRFPISLRTSAIRLVPESTWGDATARVFACDVLEELTDRQVTPPPIAEGPTWSSLVARVDPKDLAPPENPGQEHGRSTARGA